MASNDQRSVGAAIMQLVWWGYFSFFIAVKVGGSVLAGWSWWWLLMPLVPVMALWVRHLGL